MIEILFNDADLFAINKPPGLSVHEAPGPGSSVLRELREQGEAELTPVHRLDKDASGVLLFARSKTAAGALQKNWDKVEKRYQALCAGIPPENSGTVDAPILEHQTGKPERLENALKYYRKANPGVELPPIPAPKTSAVHPAGRSSQTAYRVIEAFDSPAGKFAWLEVRPQQGRMHQIRVHLAHISCPLALDRLYGNAACDFPPLTRMPLHAAALTIEWPVGSGKALEFIAPLPNDLATALMALRAK